MFETAIFLDLQKQELARSSHVSLYSGKKDEKKHSTEYGNYFCLLYNKQLPTYPLSYPSTVSTPLEFIYYVLSFLF